MFGEFDVGRLALTGVIGGVVGGLAGAILFVVKKLTGQKEAADKPNPGPDRG